MPAASGGYLAIPTRRLHGEPHPSGRGDLTVLRGLLEAIHGVSPDAIRPYLAQARAFTGGSDWEDVLRNEVIPRLASKLRGEACFRVDTLAELESPRLAGWHGWSLLAELTDPDTAVRAGVFRRTFPLQAVGFALIHNRPDDEIKRATAQAERDLQTSATQTADVPAAEPAAGGT